MKVHRTEESPAPYALVDWLVALAAARIGASTVGFDRTFMGTDSSRPSVISFETINIDQKETRMSYKTGLPRFTVPGMDTEDGAQVAAILQMRLHALNDLALTLKHAHWNVVGPHFIGVHEMIDPQVDIVRGFVDETAERIATLGVSVKGTPGAIVTDRTWSDYSIGRADTIAHLGALDVVYQGVIRDHRKAANDTQESDPVTNDMLIGHLRQLELFHWFVRAHLENSSGSLATEGDKTEKAAALDGAKIS